jgi:hypothetical protein
MAYRALHLGREGQASGWEQVISKEENPVVDRPAGQQSNAKDYSLGRLCDFLPSPTELVGNKKNGINPQKREKAEETQTDIVQCHGTRWGRRNRAQGRLGAWCSKSLTSLQNVGLMSVRS